MKTTHLLSLALAAVVGTATIGASGCNDDVVTPKTAKVEQAFGVGPFSSPPWDTNAPPECTNDAQCEYAATFAACADLPGTVRGRCQIAQGAEYGTCVDGVAKGCSAAKGCDECNLTCTCDAASNDGGTTPDAGGDGGTGDAGPACGDNVCDGDLGEDCDSCSSDCGTCGQCAPGERYCAIEQRCKQVFRCPNPGAFRHGGFECCYQADPQFPQACYLYLPPQNVYSCETPEVCGVCSVHPADCTSDDDCDDNDPATLDRCDFARHGGTCVHGAVSDVVIPPDTCATCTNKSVVRVSALGTGVVNVTGPGIDSACRSDVCLFEVEPGTALTLTTNKDACLAGADPTWSGACTSQPCVVTPQDRKTVDVAVTFP